MDDVAQEIDRAAELQRQGRLAEAELIFRRLLRVEPANPRVLKLLGALLGQTGRIGEAIAILQRAVDTGATSPDAHFNHAQALRADGRADEAIGHYQRAVELECNVADAHLALADSLRSRNLLDEALAHYQNAVRLEPKRAEIRFKLARALLENGNLNAAVGASRGALVLAPDRPEFHSQLAGLLKRQGRFEEAADQFRQTIALAPDDQSAYNALATVLRSLGRLDEALAYANESLRRAPAEPGFVVNIASIHQEKGDYDSAKQLCLDALRLDPNYAPAHINFGLLSLLTGDFAAGWEEYQWRWQAPNVDFRPQDRLKKPLWDGGSLTGKTVFVHAEQGVGDDIMFATCLPDLIEHARHCLVECDPRLVPLFSRSFPQTVILGSKGARQLPEAVDAGTVDCHIPAGDLPRYLRPDGESFPRRRQLLVPDAQKRDRWLQRYAALGPGLKVGISWQGGGDVNEKKRRSTALAQWCELLSVRGAQFINLQYGPCEDQLATMQQRFGIAIHDWDDADPLVDLDDFAAQVAALDLVISITNATVHMAGALGVTTWALLQYASTWRWFNCREDSPWYSSVRILRQRRHGDWAELFSRTTRQLRSLIATRRGAAPVLRRDPSASKSAKPKAPQSIGNPIARRWR